MAFFGPIILQENTISAGQVVSDDTVCGELHDDLKLTQPCMIFKMDVRGCCLMSQLRHSLDNDRLVVYGITPLKNDGDSDKFCVVTEPFTTSLAQWMDRCPTKAGKLDNVVFVNSLRSLIMSCISTRNLFGDFVFDEKGVFGKSSMSGIVDEHYFKVVKFEVVQPQQPVGGGPVYIKCMQCIARIIRKWFAKHNLVIQGDLKLLNCIMESLWMSKFPIKKKGLTALLISPIFLLGSDKEKAFELVLRVHWWAVKRFRYKIPRFTVDGFKKMGYTEVSESTPWYRTGMLGCALQACYNNKDDNRPNDMHHMVNGIRNLAAHVKEFFLPDTVVGTEMELCYNEVEAMRPGVWAVIHYLAMLLCPEAVADL